MYLISKYTRPIQSIITMEFQSTLTTNQLQKREKQKKSNKFSLNTHLSEYIFRPLEQPLNQFQYIISESKKKIEYSAYSCTRTKNINNIMSINTEIFQVIIYQPLFSPTHTQTSFRPIRSHIYVKQ